MQQLNFCAFWSWALKEMKPNLTSLKDPGNPKPSFPAGFPTSNDSDVRVFFLIFLFFLQSCCQSYCFQDITIVLSFSFFKRKFTCSCSAFALLLSETVKIQMPYIVPYYYPLIQFSAFLKIQPPPNYFYNNIEEW